MTKVNLIYGVGDVLHTHLNINPFATEDVEGIIRDDIVNLDKHVDDSELEELVAIDVIDYLSPAQIEIVLDNWIKKIRIGGSIILGGIDLLEVCKSLSQYRIDITEANLLIHGEQEKPYMIRKANFTAMGLAGYLESRFNFQIIKKRINNYKMIVEARRYQ
tara:strand:- start:1615 stop:2097 length:483 start_codon:yes stop_codon:yes gene_type:complete